MDNLFKERSCGYLKKILKGHALCNHLMREGYLFEYWVFPPFLEIKLNSKGKGDKNLRQKISLFAPKSNLKWREFSLLHPNNYQLTCECLAQNNNYQTIISKLSDGSSIFSYSLPLPFSDSSERSGFQIKQWKELQEDLSISAADYSHLLIVDISNCYHTIYTHSIEWACGEVNCKKIGTLIDLFIRCGMERRTHGLPVGSRLTDYVAEIVLCAIDRKIEQKYKNKRDYIGGRYRDNYYILCKGRNVAEGLLKIMSVCLREYHLNLNNDKSKIIETDLYFNKSWGTDYGLLAHQFGFEKEKIKIVKKVSKIELEIFINSILRLSHSLQHEAGVFEKALGVLEKLRPIRKGDYIKYFGLVERMYKNRIPSLPKVLLLLSILAEEDKKCNRFFRSFLKNRFWIACDNDDEFEILWISYFLNKNKYKFVSILNKLKESNYLLVKLMADFLDKNLFNKASNIDIVKKLWGLNNANTSKINIEFSKGKDTTEMSKILSVKFNYSG